MKYHDKPLVSVGIPAYNCDQYIAQSIDSILCQTHTNLELIISNNNSSDNTHEICKKMESNDPRIIYIKQDINIGAYNNFKFILDAANGSFFMWLASDDYIIDNDYIEKLLPEISTKNLDYVFSNVDVITENGIYLFSGVHPSAQTLFSEYDFGMFSLKYCSSHQFYGLFKTNCVKDYYKYIEPFTNNKCYNEGLFVHAISFYLKGAFISNVKKAYRLHDANMSKVVNYKDDLLSYIKYLFYTFLLINKNPKQNLFKLIHINFTLVYKFTKYIFVIQRYHFILKYNFIKSYLKPKTNLNND